MIRRWLSKIMYGRYGIDMLSITILIAAVFLSLIGQLTQQIVLVLISYIPLWYVIYRTLSRQTQKRYAENQKFLKLTANLRNWTSKKWFRIKDSRYHRYFKCPTCNQTLRVPKGKGKIEITCPKCKTRFTKKV